MLTLNIGAVSIVPLLLNLVQEQSVADMTRRTRQLSLSFFVPQPCCKLC